MENHPKSTPLKQIFVAEKKSNWTAKHDDEGTRGQRLVETRVGLCVERVKCEWMRWIVKMSIRKR